MPPVLGHKWKLARGQFREIFILCKLEKEFKVFISINKKRLRAKEAVDDGDEGIRYVILSYFLYH